MEVFHRDPLILTKPVASVLRLGMVGRNPVQILKDYMRSCRQGDANATGNDVAESHPDIQIGLKPVD